MKNLTILVFVFFFHELCMYICLLHSGLQLNVLSAQAYKLTKAKYTLTNEAMSDFHRKTVSDAVSIKKK